MNPIDHLLQEHREIMAQVADLRAAVRTLAERGDAALPDVLPALRQFGHMMETTLALHARKEDEALFPAMEAIFGSDDTPTAVMRMEHVAIHERGALFRRTLVELQDVEHPAILTRGEALRTLAAAPLASGQGRSAALRATAQEIVELIDAHFGKEEQILFPMALEMLDPEALAEVGRKMQTLRSA